MSECCQLVCFHPTYSYFLCLAQYFIRNLFQSSSDSTSAEVLSLFPELFDTLFDPPALFSGVHSNTTTLNSAANGVPNTTADDWNTALDVSDDDNIVAAVMQEVEVSMSVFAGSSDATAKVGPSTCGSFRGMGSAIPSTSSSFLHSRAINLPTGKEFALITSKRCSFIWMNLWLKNISKRFIRLSNIDSMLSYFLPPKQCCKMYTFYES